MSYIHLVIKGDIDASKDALMNRGMTADYVEYIERWSACTFRADTGYWGRVAQWYNETLSAPYPAGTLLFFSFKQDDSDLLGNGMAEASMEEETSCHSST